MRDACNSAEEVMKSRITVSALTFLKVIRPDVNRTNFQNRVLTEDILKSILW